jgi:hypothetical protein
VTFKKDSDGFYATLASGGVNYLIEGGVNSGNARVLREGIECPSLSPDNTKIAYKERIPGVAGWHLRIYDVTSAADYRLSAEDRRVDDQVEWLDNSHILYNMTGEHNDVYVLAVDNSQPPRVFRRDAYSPGLVR